MNWSRPQQITRLGTRQYTLQHLPQVSPAHRQASALDTQQRTSTATNLYLQAIGLKPSSLCNTRLGTLADTDATLSRYPSELQRYTWHIAAVPQLAHPPHDLQHANNMQVLSYAEDASPARIAGLFYDTPSADGSQHLTKALNIAQLGGSTESGAFEVFHHFAALHERLTSSIYEVHAEATRLVPTRLYGSDHPIRYPHFPGVFPVHNQYAEAMRTHYLPACIRRSARCDDMRILVMGAGAGICANELAHALQRPIDAVDIQRIAVANTLAGSLYAGTTHLVRAWVSDLFSHVHERYDAIIFNAPFAQSGFAGNRAQHCPNRHDPGGVILDRFLRNAPQHLRAGGEIFLMAPSGLATFMPTTALRCSTLTTFRDSRRQRRPDPYGVHRLTV